jgi:hypothetical protein
LRKARMAACQPSEKRGTEGAIFVEFLIAFLPVFTFFLCLVQLGLLFAIKLLVDHAAVNCARTAAVVIGDDPKAFDTAPEPLHEVRKGSARYQLIERAALYTLAPFIIDGTLRNIKLEFPKPEDPAGKDQANPKWNPMSGSTIDKVRVRVLAQATCKIGLANRIACGEFGLTPSDLASDLLQGPSIWVRAEAVYPYQGASYAYK